MYTYRTKVTSRKAEQPSYLWGGAGISGTHDTSIEMLMLIRVDEEGETIRFGINYGITPPKILGRLERGQSFVVQLKHVNNIYAFCDVSASFDSWISCTFIAVGVSK